MVRPIPEQIDDEEILIRGIGHHLYYSTKKSKLKVKAYTPPPDSSEVSLYRLEYTTESGCKKQAKKLDRINGFTYCGLAASKKKRIEDINCVFDETKYTLDNGKTLKIVISFSPMNEFGNRYNHKVTTESPGLPFHADMVYENWVAKKGVPAPTILKKIWKLLTETDSKYVRYFHDKDPESEAWAHGRIVL